MRKYIQWFFRAMRPYGFSLFGMLFFHIVLIASSLAFVYLSKSLVDTALGGTFSWHLTVLFLAVIVFRVVFNSLKNYLQTKIFVGLRNDLRMKLFDVLLRHQSDGTQPRHSGDVVNRLQEDVRVVASTFSTSIPNVIGTSIHFIAAFAYLMYLDSSLAWIVVVILPIALVLTRFVAGKIRRLTRKIRDDDSNVQAHLQENVQNLAVLKSMDYEDESSATLGSLQDVLYKSEMRRLRFSLISRSLIGIAFTGGYAVAFLWSVNGLILGTITYGMMVAFLQLVSQVQRPILEISNQLPTIIHSMASVDRLSDIEMLPQEKYGKPHLLQAPVGLRFENVSFTFPEGKIIFTDFSHNFKPGSATAVVGPTGVGKSTMVRLILSFLKPNSGTIKLYSGIPSSASEAMIDASTRGNIVYVPQGNSLFSGTVRDNLYLGNPDATEEEISKALHTAVAEFVLELPKGLETPCFESGGGLSEGQAQRIAIARALLRPGSILLFDEFSSALDPDTESLLLERLTKDLSHKTMIFVTHREKVLDYCNSILRL